MSSLTSPRAGDESVTSVPAAGDDQSAPRRTLVLMQALALGCLLFIGVRDFEALMALDTGPVVVLAAASNALCLVTLAVGWTIRHHTRSRRTRAVIAIVVVSAASVLAMWGSLSLNIAPLLLALALVVIDVSRRAGIITGIVLASAVALVHVLTGSPWLAVAVNAVSVATLAAFGWGYGVLWLSFVERHDVDQRLIAERDEAVDRLRRSHQNEKELVLAEERARAAHELHDGLGHRLTSIGMSLEFAERSRDRMPDAAWQEVATARRTASEAMQEMRTWVRALSPVRDDDATGVAAFDAIAQSFRGTGVDVRVIRDDVADRDLDPDTSLLLYRALQEGLTNALRHGRARNVTVSFRQRGPHVTLRMVSDLAADRRDALPHGPIEPGFGLRGIAARAIELGGGATAERVDDTVILEVVARLDEPECSPSAMSAGDVA